MEKEEFLKLVKDKFGDKVRCEQIKDITNEAIEKLGIKKEDILNYPTYAWLNNDDDKGNPKCPECDVQLFGILGSFNWEIPHGYGYCTNCKKVGFKFYHYVGNPEKRFELLAVTSF